MLIRKLEKEAGRLGIATDGILAQEHQSL